MALPLQTTVALHTESCRRPSALFNQHTNMNPGFVATPAFPSGSFRVSSRSTGLGVRYAAPKNARAVVRATLEVPVDEDGSALQSEEWTAESVSKGMGQRLTVLSIDDIMKVLPHRYPFLLLDRVVLFEPGKRAIAIKNVSINEPFFSGHFPKRPIMPGVLQVEALAQVCGIVMLQPPVSDGKGDFYFGGVDGVRWRRPVVPGDTLVLEAELKSFKKRFGIAKMSGR